MSSKTLNPQKKSFRAIFNLGLKVIWDCIGLALLHSVIGLETRATF